MGSACSCSSNPSDDNPNSSNNKCTTTTTTTTTTRQPATTVVGGEKEMTHHSQFASMELPENLEFAAVDAATKDQSIFVESFSIEEGESAYGATHQQQQQQQQHNNNPRAPSSNSNDEIFTDDHNHIEHFPPMLEITAASVRSNDGSRDRVSAAAATAPAAGDDENMSSREQQQQATISTAVIQVQQSSCNDDSLNLRDVVVDQDDSILCADAAGTTPPASGSKSDRQLRHTRDEGQQLQQQQSSQQLSPHFRTLSGIEIVSIASSPSLSHEASVVDPRCQQKRGLMLPSDSSRSSMPNSPGSGGLEKNMGITPTATTAAHSDGGPPGAAAATPDTLPVQQPQQQQQQRRSFSLPSFSNPDSLKKIGFPRVRQVKATSPQPQDSRAQQPPPAAAAAVFQKDYSLMSFAALSTGSYSDLKTQQSATTTTTAQQHEQQQQLEEGGVIRDAEEVLSDVPDVRTPTTPSMQNGDDTAFFEE